MNTDVFIVGGILWIVSVIFLWSNLIYIEDQSKKRIKEIEDRVTSLELDEFLRIAFQTDSERIDRYIKKQMEAIAERKIQEHKEKMKKILEGDNA